MFPSLSRRLLVPPGDGNDGPPSEAISNASKRPATIVAFKDGAVALDKRVEQEEVAKKVIGSTEFQNKARVGRNQYRKVLGVEYVRELILK